MSDKTTFFEAIVYNDINSIRAFVDSGFDYRYGNDFVLQQACLYGSLELVRYFVGLGCDPRCNNDHCLECAAGNGYLDIVIHLLQQGCDPRSGGKHCITWAKSNGNTHIVSFLEGYITKVLKEGMKLEQYIDQCVVIYKSFPCFSRVLKK